MLRRRLQELAVNHAARSEVVAATCSGASNSLMGMGAELTASLVQLALAASCRRRAASAIISVRGGALPNSRISSSSISGSGFRTWSCQSYFLQLS